MTGVDLFGSVSIADTGERPNQAGTFATVYADPPWLERGAGQCKRGADRHYPLMTTDAICALPVSSWMLPDAHAYVWVTNNFLPDGLRVLDAWGFRYVTKIDWFKGDLFDVTDEHIEQVMETVVGGYVGTHITVHDVDQLARRLTRELLTLMSTECHRNDDDRLQVGLGQYFRGCTESCLFGVRGNVPYRTRPDGKRAQGRTGFHAPRGEHSVKPEKMRQMVELVSPGPYLEMFARRPAPGWSVWGNEVEVEQS